MAGLQHRRCRYHHRGVPDDGGSHPEAEEADVALYEKVLELTVDPIFASERLDVFLAKASGLSRAKIQRLIEQGRVLVDGRPKKAGAKVLTGQKVRLALPPPEPLDIPPEPIPLKILYEDQDVLVLDKPTGLVVHPAAGHRSGTLVNALLHHDPAFAHMGEHGRPGIVHRLDKETSGAMVVAKTEDATLDLQRQFKARRVKKVYLALVHGEVRQSEGRIELPIGRHEEDRKRMGVRTKKGREAVTRFRVLRRSSGFTLLELHPETGRTHQIRVHLSAIGHPIVGDKVYGGHKAKGKVKAERQLLHAWKLGFFHPRTGEWLEFEAPLPDDLQGLLSKGEP